MNFVTPAVALGNLDEAADGDLRRHHGIEAVLSLTEVEFQAGAHHAVVAVQDRLPLAPAAIASATGFIRRQVVAGRKVLVHCQMGISRSPALVACYLHQYGGLALDDALDLILLTRPCAAPHPALLESIRSHYAGAAAEEIRA